MSDWVCSFDTLSPRCLASVAGSGMGGRCRNPVVRRMNQGSCFAGGESFRGGASEGPARVERGRSMRSIAGPGNRAISRHQPRDAWELGLSYRKQATRYRRPERCFQRPAGPPGCSGPCPPLRPTRTS